MYLLVLDLGKNDLGEAGHQLAKTIRSWGDGSPLQELWLYNCSLTAAASLALVKALSICKQLNRLNLRENNLSKSGHLLAQSIRYWGEEPALQKLWLYNCSISTSASLELVQSLTRCKQLTVLNLGKLNLSKAAHHLLESIKSWGEDSPLQDLFLYNCSLPVAVSIELLKSLAAFRQLTALNLGKNDLGEAGYQLAQTIRSWGDEPPLQALRLQNCLLTEAASIEIVQSLSICRHLTVLNLGKNFLGEAAHLLSDTIRSWGNDPPLQKLYLSDCSMPAHASEKLLRSLATCTCLTDLDLRGNGIDEAGRQLAQSILFFKGNFSHSDSEATDDELEIYDGTNKRSLTKSTKQEPLCSPQVPELDERDVGKTQTFSLIGEGEQTKTDKHLIPGSNFSETIISDYHPDIDDNFQLTHYSSHFHCANSVPDEKSSSQQSKMEDLEVNETNFSEIIDYESEGGVANDEQHKINHNAMKRHITQETVQEHLYEQTTSLGINIRRYEGEMLEYPDTVPLESVGAELLVEYLVPQSTDYESEKHSLEELSTEQVTQMYQTLPADVVCNKLIYNSEDLSE